MSAHEMVIFEIDDFVEDFTHCFTGECRVNVLPVLFQISQIITDDEDLATSLGIVLKVMQQRLKMQRGMVTLLDRESDRAFIQQSFGLQDEQKTQGNYSLENGISGKVVESGKAMMAPQRRNAAGRRARAADQDDGVSANASFLCVPIIHAKKVLGTISAERGYYNRRLLKQDVELLATIASMIAPAVELYLLEHVDKARLENENRNLKHALKERFKPSNIIGNSKPMLEVYELIRKVAAVKATVLILGESGVGKELVANAIHYNSAAAGRPIRQIQLRGSAGEHRRKRTVRPRERRLYRRRRHAQGPFRTGRRRHHLPRRNRRILPSDAGQAAARTAGKDVRAGRRQRPVKVDLRIIAATNRDLLDMVAKGTFREDLYYRLNVFPMTIPPLRERGSDVILLADHFVARNSTETGKEVKRISTPALNMLMAYHWPGNVRELENVIERSVILSEDGVVHGYNLPPSLQTSAETGTAFGCGLDAKIEAVEYEMIVEALKTHQGNMTEAAKELGLTRRILGLRMEKHSISYKTFRRPEPVR